MTSSTVAAMVGLALAGAVPALGLYRRRVHDDPPGWSRVRRVLATNAGIVLAAVGLVAVAGSPADAGLGVPSVDAVVDGFLYGFVAFGGTMVAVSLVGEALGGVTADPASVVVMDQPLWRRLLVAVTGATIESLLFYGVALEAVLALGGGRYVAGAVAAACLLLVRLRWSYVPAVQWVPGALVLSGIALYAGTVLPVLAVRLLYDALTLGSGDPTDYADAG